MMLNHNDHQPSYSIEQVHADQSDDLQDGRLYECTYCKHGFTNAQALGGHMNVHRKERAKNRFDSTNNKINNTRLHEPCTCLIRSCIRDHVQERKTREFMLSSSLINPNGSIIGPSQDEVSLSLNLSLPFGQSYEEESIHRGDEDDEMDLELRL